MAVALLRERGYAGLSISAVCERADISPTSLYWHFGNKAGLMEAVVERTSGHAERIHRAVRDAAGNPRERLRKLIASIRELVLTQPLGSLTGVTLLSEGAHASAELRDTLMAARQTELELATSEFQAQLGVDAREGEALATLVMACTNYAAMTYRWEHSEAEVDRILGSLEVALQMLGRTRGAVT